MTDAAAPTVIKAKPVPSFSVHLDTVRGLAALAVFIGHGTYMFLGTSIRDQTSQHLDRAVVAIHAHPLADRTHLGHQAVIIFFVLSGYFVGGGAVRALRLARWSWKAYILQRLTRLWMVLIPALLFGLSLDLIGIHYFGTAPPVYAKLLDPISGATGAGRLGIATFWGNLFFLQGIRVPIFGSNAPLWSLSYEFWYYVLFPLLLIGVSIPKRFAYRACLIVAAIAAAVFCGREISLYFLIWLAGVGAYLLPIRLSPSLSRRITPLLSLVFLGFNVYVVARPFNLVLSDFSTALFFTALLWLILHYREPVGESLYRRAATRLSAMSYTLYAVHYPMLALLSTWLVSKATHRGISPRMVALLLFAYVVVFLVAYLLYRCFESNTDSVRGFIANHLRLAPGGPQAALPAQP